MKIKLVRLFFSQSIYKLYGKLPKKREVRNPLGLMILANILKKNGHIVEIIDGELEGLYNHRLSYKCTDADIVGITCTTPEFAQASDLVDRVKSLNPKCKIVIGGPHPTVVPKECLEENGNIDFVVRYEGEKTFLDLLNNIDNPKDVKGIAYRAWDKAVINEDRELLNNLDLIRYNANWDSVDLKKYYYPFPKEGLVPTANISAGRGCPYKCKFCYRMFGHKVRIRNYRDVVHEIEFIIKNYGIKHFFFYDECFGLDKNWLRDFVSAIKDLNIKFFCMSRANLLTDEVIELLVEGGLTSISIGVESGNQGILDNDSKGTTLEQYERAYETLSKYNIETRGSFIIGHPHETHDTVRDTIDFAKSLKLYRAAFNIMTPYPGTEIMNEDGIEVLSGDYSGYCRWGESVVRTDELSQDDLKSYQKKATMEFYLSIKVLWYHLKQFILGERSMYYYRPLLFAIKEKLK